MLLYLYKDGGTGCFSIITIAHSLATSELKGASTAYASEVLLVHHDELSQ